MADTAIEIVRSPQARHARTALDVGADHARRLGELELRFVGELVACQDDAVCCCESGERGKGENGG